MIPRICYSTTITASVCKPCSVTQFRTLMSDPRVQDICDQIKLLDGSDPEELARLKRQLPIITPHAQRFTDDHRSAATAVPSGLVMLDIDHLDNPRGWFESFIQNHPLPLLGKGDGEKGSYICFIAITPSGHGLRIIADMIKTTQKGQTLMSSFDIAEAQSRLANALGFTTYDSCTKDLSRASFVMPMSYVLYMDESAFEFPDQESADHFANVMSLTPELHSNIPHSADADTTPRPIRERSGEGLLFHSVPYSSIISHLIALLGGTPEYGERNTFYFTLVRYARYICDFNPDHIFDVLPDFGLAETERKSVITSAVNRPRKSETPDLINRALTLAQAEQKADNSSLAPLGERVPERAEKGSNLPPLPRVLDIICRRLPEDFRPAMIIAALPILGTLATRVRFRYLDNAVHSFSFMSCITAPAATGKSFIRRPINLLLTPIDEQDAIEREKEQEYKDALRANKNSRHQPENPRACPRNNGINISIAKLLQLLSYSDGKHLIGIGEEIDTLVKSEKAGVWSQKSDIYRLGFDNAKYGQCYMSDNSYSANLPVYYNLLLTGTPGGMYRFFRDVEDGLVTRFCFAQLPDMFGAELPDFQNYTRREEDEIIHTARQLDMTVGTIACPEVDQAIRDWLEQKRQLAISTDSRAIDTLRRRAAVIGFRAGYLAALLNGESIKSGSKSRKPKKGTSSAFALWVAEYVFTNQMNIFGSQFEKVADEYFSSVGKRGSVRRLLQSLPDTFTRNDLMALRVRYGQTSDVSYVITRWRNNHLIEEVSPNTFRKL